MCDQNKTYWCIYRQQTQPKRIFFPCQRQKILCLICITHVYIYILHTVRIISGVHPRTHTDPLFTDLKLLKWQEIYKHLVVRLIYGIYNEGVTLFKSMSIKFVQFHNYDTRQRDHDHVPRFKSRLGKIKLRFNSVIVLNNILSIGGPVDTSHAVFLKKL